MKTQPPRSAPGWVLHVHADAGCTGTLVYDFGAGGTFMMDIPPGFSSLLLALIVAREMDVRAGRPVKQGHRSLIKLGVLIAAMPGPGNPVSESTLGGKKRGLLRRLKREFATFLSELGMDLDVDMPIKHPGYGMGYCLPECGVRATGVDLDELVIAAENELTRATRAELDRLAALQAAHFGSNEEKSQMQRFSHGDVPVRGRVGWSS